MFLMTAISHHYHANSLFISFLQILPLGQQMQFTIFFKYAALTTVHF